MTVRMLDPIFKPRRIALVGVTPNPKSVGGKILSNLVGGGFPGVVYPVNAAHEAVMGISCFPRVKDLPRTPDLAILCAAASQVPDLLRECGESGIKGAIIASAGFREAGPAGKNLEDKLRAIGKEFDGMRIVGPNCLGVIAPGHRLNASFAPVMPDKGGIAFISQSGALGTAILDRAAEGKIGFSYFVSIGNAIDVDFGDLIDYFGEDEETKAILLYIESIDRVRPFMTAARAFARTKPIIAYKAGRFPESAQVAASHTGALAGEDAVYDAAFRRIGMVRVNDIGEIFDIAELLGRRKIPKGPRLGIVTNAGGPGVMATDALFALDGALGTLSPTTMKKLDETLPPIWSHRNPVDVLGDANSKRVSKTVATVVQDEGIDAVLVIITPQAMTNPTAIAKELGLFAQAAKKPILAAWMGGGTVREGIRILNEAGIPAYATPEQAVRAFMTLVSYSRNLGTLYETPKDISVEFPVDRNVIRRDFASLLVPEAGTLSETDSKSLLEAYGIPTTQARRASSAEEAVRLAEAVGWPVVIKILSPDITHKSDVGGVVLDIGDAQTLRRAFARMTASIKAARPEARIEGVTVQKMISKANGTELILGIKKDPTFGTVVMAGLGGIAAELFGDRALGFPPLNERLARMMLESLEIYPLLRGFRGRPAADIEGLVEALIRLSYLASDFPEIGELDINPLFVSPEGVCALDARIVIDPRPLAVGRKPYDHLAIRPYPEEYVRKIRIGATRIVLRPIKPEDEPLWTELLAGCSRETIYSRFRHFFIWQSHDVAARYCTTDYERELAIVAETVEDGRRRLLGVGRLIADPERRTAEYAILVSDAWQNRGLGNAITSHALGLAEEWGIRNLTAVTTTDNPRMIAVFRKLGFDVVPDETGASVRVAKELGK